MSDREFPELPLPEHESAEARDSEREDVASNLEFFNDGLSSEVESGWVELNIQWSAARRTPILRSYEIGLNGELVGRIEASEDGAQVNLLPNLPHPLFDYDGRIPESERPDLEESESRCLGDTTSSEYEYWRGDHLPVGGLSRSSLPRWGELLDIEFDECEDFYAYPFREFRYRVSTLMVGAGELLRDEIEQLRYVGPMRDVLPRSYTPPRYLEPHRWASGLGAWDLMHARGGEFVRRVSDWLSDPDKLDVGYGVEIRRAYILPQDSALWRSIDHGTFLDVWSDFVGEFFSLDVKSELRLVDPNGPVAAHPSAVGVGVSQVVPVVVAAIDPDRPGLTAIEQPELHIHPKVQVGLGDLFASQIEDGTGCFLLETHSEHLMLRLLRRIEETNSGDLPSGVPPLRPEQVSVVFIEQVGGEITREVRATQVRIDETGEFIDRWPHGFFEERADELI